MGKPAVNLKLSHFKQIIKSCRGGISMVIHRMPGNRRPQQRRGSASGSGPSLAQSTLTLRGIREGGGGSMSDFAHYPSSLQTPGTPGSNLSETTGYYSTQSTSLPSVCSAAISPSTLEIKAGMTGIPTSFGRRTSPSLNLKSVPSQTSTSQHSGYETDQASFDVHHLHFRDSSVSSSTANTNPYSSSSLSSRALGDISNPYTRPLYFTGGGGIGGVNGNSSRTRMSSQSSYGGSSQLSSSILSPKSDATASSSSRFGYTSRNNHHQLPSPSPFSVSVPRNSFSVDRLESSRPPHPRMSGDSHVTSSSSMLAGGSHSMSTSNMYRNEMSKRTNV